MDEKLRGVDGGSTSDQKAGSFSCAIADSDTITVPRRNFSPVCGWWNEGAIGGDELTFFGREGEYATSRATSPGCILEVSDAFTASHHPQPGTAILYCEASRPTYWEERWMNNYLCETISHLDRTVTQVRINRVSIINTGSQLGVTMVGFKHRRTWTFSISGSTMHVPVQDTDVAEMTAAALELCGLLYLTLLPSPQEQEVIIKTLVTETHVVLGPGAGQVCCLESRRVPHLWSPEAGAPAAPVLDPGTLVLAAVQLASGHHEVLRTRAFYPTEWLMSQRGHQQDEHLRCVSDRSTLQVEDYLHGTQNSGKTGSVSNWVLERSILVRIEYDNQGPLRQVPPLLVDARTGKEVLSGLDMTYVAVSYVWSQWPRRKDLTREVSKWCQQLGVEYFWLDQICIDQENDTEKARQVPRMADYYGGAALTMVMVPDVRERKMVEVLHPSEVRTRAQVRADASFYRELLACKWKKRIWTLQEQAVSTNLLYATHSQLVDGVAAEEAMAVKSGESFFGALLTAPIGVYNTAGHTGTGCIWVRETGTGISAQRLRGLPGRRLLPYGEVQRLALGRDAERGVDRIYGLMAMINWSSMPRVDYSWSLEECSDWIMEQGLLGTQALAMYPKSQAAGQCWRPSPGCTLPDTQNTGHMKGDRGEYFAISSGMAQLQGWLLKCRGVEPGERTLWMEGKCGRTRVHFIENELRAEEMELLVVRAAEKGGGALAGVWLSDRRESVAHFRGTCLVDLHSAVDNDLALGVTELRVGLSLGDCSK